MTSTADDPTPYGVLLRVAYDGGAFHGFAIQTNAQTIAGEILKAVQVMDPSVTEVRGASRTDAGVHAQAQPVALDACKAIPCRGWVLGLNAKLPPEIAVRSASRVAVGLQPRHCAIGKHYRYTCLVDSCRDPFLDRYAWRIASMNLDLARQEAQDLLGTHDFRAFRSASDERENTVRTLTSVELSHDPHDGRVLRIDVRGSAFLHNMVRILVGTLVDVARGVLAPGAVRRALDSGLRSDLGMTAPARGLSLQFVDLAVEAETDRWPRSGTTVRDAAT